MVFLQVRGCFGHPSEKKAPLVLGISGACQKEFKLRLVRLGNDLVSPRDAELDPHSLLSSQKWALWTPNQGAQLVDGRFRSFM